MNDPATLLARLDAIGQSLSTRETARALLGLGSVGMEQERLDRFSDLDFFVIVQGGSKADYLNRLDWLSNVAPIAFAFMNTADGYKVLFEDGIFCEFAVFEEKELETAAFTPGRIVWMAADVEERIAQPQRKQTQPETPTSEWLLGEALTNLYVGLLRHHRGEKLSAMRFIQVYALDRVLELIERQETAAAATRDPFSRERRFEARYPAIAAQLAQFVQGYEGNQQSALALLAFLDERFPLNPTLKQMIYDLC